MQGFLGLSPTCGTKGSKRIHTDDSCFPAKLGILWNFRINNLEQVIGFVWTVVRCLVKFLFQDYL